MRRNAIGPKFEESGRRWCSVGAFEQMHLHPSIKDGGAERRMES